MMEGIQRGSFDGAFLIGYHSSATEANGVLAHTIFGRVIAGIRLNGRECSETLLSAATAGYFGVPVLMVRGTTSTSPTRRRCSAISTAWR